ncbi:MAG: glutathione S-transferase family protein [Kofleriaceae bacterium]|nr:glutathione S-transferase family protein [Myxococcales bacterium]MCB9559222.1 glutathione S-transferase family protein [Kofleriaceae bacterium]MCB9574886.1 glutathione S-transferase family protein [Kofleriaceae bacterium]
MPALILHVGTKHLSSWSLRPYLAIAHARLPCEDRTIVLDRPDSRARLLEASPSGRVPVLVHGDLVIWDSLAICEYVAELAPAAGLWPAAPAIRARARAVSAEMHAGFAALRRDMPMDLVTAHPGEGHTADALADAARVMEIWRDCRAHAGDGGPFLFGAFTIADAMYAPVATRFQTYGVAMDDVCRAYVDAIEALPAMQAWRRDARAAAAAT